MPELDLNTPVGRRAVKTFEQNVQVVVGEKFKVIDLDKGLDAFIAVLTSDVCPKCKGQQLVAGRFMDYAPCPNPDCVNGKVKPALVLPE